MSFCTAKIHWTKHSSLTVSSSSSLPTLCEKPSKCNEGCYYDPTTYAEWLIISQWAHAALRKKNDIKKLCITRLYFDQPMHLVPSGSIVRMWKHSWFWPKTPCSHTFRVSSRTQLGAALLPIHPQQEFLSLFFFISIFSPCLPLLYASFLCKHLVVVEELLE